MKQSIKFCMTILLSMISSSSVFSKYDYYEHIYPENTDIYVIGDFNDWQIPGYDGYVWNTRGAIRLYDVCYTTCAEVNASYNEIKAVEMFPKGDTRFVIYVCGGKFGGFYHDESLTAVYGDDSRPTPIYFSVNPFAKNGDDNIGIRETFARNTLDKERAFVLKDWNGGIIRVHADKYETEGISKLDMRTDNPSYISSPAKLYSVYEIDGNPEETEECDAIIGYLNAPTASLALNQLVGKSFKISFLTEPSAITEESQGFGALYPNPIFVENDMVFKIPIIEGGYPIEINLREEAKLNITIHPVTKTLRAYVKGISTGIDPICVNGTNIRYVDGRLVLDYPTMISVYDTLGNVILSEFASEISISGLPSGIYIAISDSSTLKICK